MDSHSRSASPRDSARPQHRPPSPPTPTAFDNRGFSHDEGDQNHNDSFTSNPPQQNGHSKEPNGDTKTLEAVNLELINLTPKNGSKKKDVEVDMNATNPYDEYFVPVNEHRKYMRGEKLYVTADKRGEKGGCKRPLCWTLLGLVVAAIVALIVLAATGVLFTNSPTTVEQYNTSISSARALGGISSFPEDKTDLNHPEHNHPGHNHHEHIHDDHADHEHNAETTPQTQNDEALDGPMGSDEMADASMYIPRTVEGELRIDNEEFTPEMQNPDSMEYQQFTATFTEALKKAIFDRNTIENSDNDIIVEVIEIKEGSLLVTYRIHWIPKQNAETKEDLLTAKTLQTKLNEYLAKNNRMISTYHIAEDKMPTRPVFDLCKFNNNECQNGCEFDETSLDFTCTCPLGQIIDIANPKKCTTLFPAKTNFNEDTEQRSKAFDMDSNPTTMTPISEEEKPNQFDTVINLSNQKRTESSMEEESIERHNSHAPEPEPEPTSEPAPEPSTEPTSVIGIHHVIEPIAEPTAEPATEPAAEPTAEPAAVPTVEPSAEPSAEPAAEPSAEPAAEPSAEPTAEPAAEPSAEPTAEPTAEPAAEPKAEPAAEPAPEPSVQPIVEPTAEPSAEPTAEPSAAPSAEPAAKPSSVSIAELFAEPTPEPSAEPTTEHTSDKLEKTSKSNMEFDLMHLHSVIEPEDTAETESSSEPEPTLSTVFESSPVAKENEKDTVSNSFETAETERTFIEVKPNAYQNEFIIHNTADASSVEATTTGEQLSTSERTGETEVSTESDWLVNDKNVAAIYKTEEFSQSRSFSFNNNEILAETTTTAGNNNEEISFNNLINQNNTPTNETKTITSNDTTESSMATSIPVTTVSNLSDQATSNNNYTLEEEIVTMPKDNAPKLTESILTETTTVAPEISTELSLDKLQTFNEGKNFMNDDNATAEKVMATVPVTTENNAMDDGVDITFEEIKESSSYNRSSKSITNENSTMKISTESNSTTESDWLVENITEIPFDDNMNNVKTPLTTEGIVSKDELSNGGDFEPDYLNNMGTTESKVAETDVPLYGMAQDYDGDLRVKRVNEEQVPNTTPIMLQELVTKPITKETTTQGSSGNVTPVNSIETTTITDYIYKTSGQDMNKAPSDVQPAPVWEPSESGTDFSIRELPTTTPAPTTTASSSNTEANKYLQIDNNTETFSSQNSTQINNLNVNVYEVSSHKENSTFSTTGANSLSAENEDQESENPFLPEVENNKHLVKKLQEGHDLEPTNLNETQNENSEDHNINVFDTSVSSSNEAATTVKERIESTTEIVESKIVSNDLINEPKPEDALNAMANDTETISIDSNMDMNDASKPDLPEQTSVVSSFLLDTDDLDTRDTTTTSDGMLRESNSIPDDFSVIPVAKKNPEKDSFKSFDSESKLNLNDITSDSIKNSDRTQKVTFNKFNSINAA